MKGQDIKPDVTAVAKIGSEATRRRGLIGMAAGIADDARVMAVSTQGLRQKGRTESVTLRDRWHIGSITKSLTTVLIGTLVAERRLNVDMPLPDLLSDVRQEIGLA